MSDTSAAPEPLAPAAQPAAVETYTFGARIPKLIYLLIGLGFCTLGMIFNWEILGRMWQGEIATGRIAEIRVIEPGQPDISYTYRRTYTPESNLNITFQHYIDLIVEGRPERFRISVDSRRAPIDYYNVNDEVKVAFYPQDPHHLAYDYAAARTWGAGAVFSLLGVIILMTGIPLLWATFKPIVIDP